VRFQNDLGQPIVLELCQSDHSTTCDHPYYRDSFPAGFSGEEMISTNYRTEWAVADTHGRLLRCVLLYWRHYNGVTPTIRLSMAPTWASPCPRQLP
jgi:hypothetical protein